MTSRTRPALLLAILSCAAILSTMQPAVASAQSRQAPPAELASASIHPGRLGADADADTDTVAALTPASIAAEPGARPSPSGAVRHEVLLQLQQTEADSAIARLNAIYETH
jgi:hypothetical protein